MNEIYDAVRDFPIGPEGDELAFDLLPAKIAMIASIASGEDCFEFLYDEDDAEEAIKDYLMEQCGVDPESRVDSAYTACLKLKVGYNLITNYDEIQNNKEAYKSFNQIMELIAARMEEDRGYGI